jgi:PAS domain S-box-containing protein
MNKINKGFTNEELINEIKALKQELKLLRSGDALALAKKELIFQREKKDDLIDELVVVKKEKSARVDALALAKKELIFESEKKDDLIDELVVVKKEKAKRADELVVAKKEKAKRADELVVAKKEKAKRADELVVAKKEKAKRADELVVAKKEKAKRADELALAKKELAFQKEIEGYRSKMENVALELTLLIDTANAPIFGIDSKGLVNEWNQTSEKITGFTKEEVLGKDLVQTYITEDYRKSVKQVLDDALKGKETANYEFPLFSKDGDRLMVLLNSSTRRSVNGKINGVLGVGQDITELVGSRKKLERRTRELDEALKNEKELNELKSRFVSIASHEFRTPLSAINFAAGSIKKYRDKMEPIMVAKKLDKIENQVLHMTQLLDDILIVGQAEAGEIRNHPLTLNLGEFISEIIEEVYSSFNESHEVLLIGPEELKSTDIFIDEKLGRNIFINLLSNAVKFSPNAHQVTVELSSEKDHTIISVTDFGIGIPKSEVKNIFTPFTRGKNVDLIQGTGLGLSIVKEAVDLIGGEIVINSKVGKGTTFSVKILKQTNK